MKSIQFLLMTGILFIGLYFFVQLKKRVLDIVLFSMLLATAAAFILWPELTNILAKAVGVGRGVDLVFYLAILIFWFVILKLFARIRKLEKALTEFVRKEAITDAAYLADHKHTPYDR
jgi:small membrane protein